MSVPQFQHAVVVLGMHRSGTSALAGMLGLAGLAMPRTLLPPSSGNERGLWESESVKSLNEDVLGDLGTTWHGVGEVSLTALGRRKAGQVRKLAEEILISEYGDSLSFVVKDPRMCRLLPVWQPVFAGLGARASYPVILRNPLEVAQSLSQRNGFDPEYGMLLWARYLLDAELGTRGSPRVFLTYDQLLEDWQSVLGRIGSSLEIPVDPGSIDVGNVEDFLSTDLRHHRIADEQVFIELAKIPQVSETYRVLLSWAEGKPESPADFEALDRIRVELDRTGLMVSNLVERARLDRKRLASLKTQADETAVELAKTRRSSDNLDAVRATLAEQSKAHARLEKALESAVASLSKALSERTSLEDAVKEGLKSQKELQAQVERAREDASRAAEEYHRNRATADDRHKQEMEALAARSEAAERRHSEEAEASEQRLNALTRKHDELETELKDVKRKYRSTQHQLARDQEKLRKSQFRLVEAEATISRMRQAFGWRISAWSAGQLHRLGILASRAVGGGDRKARELQVEQIRRSPYFDATWYLSRYSDVAGAGGDAALHFLQHGWREGRDPGPEFSTSAYLKANLDVARSGQNPLLHYIEFGHSEGRSISARAPAIGDAPTLAFDNEFGPAAPCASFPISKSKSTRWTRAARFDETRSDLVSIGDVPVGYHADARLQAALRGHFEDLAQFSGFLGASATPEEIQEEPVQISERLIDAWQSGDGRLRLRWSTEDDGCVVRAYQHDPEKDGSLELVGEGLLTSITDFVDANLRNPFFPLLLVLADPDGTIRGSKLLAFPSLCRGGAHYPELLVLAREATGASRPIDIIGQGEALGEQLRAVLDGAFAPLLSGLVIDLAGSDGAERVFQADIQAWFSKVMRVEVTAAPIQGHHKTVEYLADAVHLDGGRGKQGGKLVLAADMIPTIGALVAARGDGHPVKTEVVLPIVVAGSEPAQPVTLIELPLTDAGILKAGAPDHSAAWPRLIPGKACRLADRPLVAAIRQSPREPAEAELLFPIAQPVALGSQDCGAITWLVASEDIAPERLAQIIEALSLQAASSQASVSFLGEVSAEIMSLANRLFVGRVREFSEIELALADVDSPLVGYVGPNVILHDSRTAQLLSTILDGPGSESASCVIVFTERRGKGWHASVMDQGALAGLPGPDQSSGSQLFWRANYPASLPPRDFWLARTSDVAGWLQRAGPLRSNEGMHVCTSLVTAAYLAERGETAPPIRPPVAQNAVRLEAIL